MKITAARVVAAIVCMTLAGLVIEHSPEGGVLLGFAGAYFLTLALTDRGA